VSNWVWQLPLRSFTGLRGIAPWYYTWLRHPNYDRFWARLDVERRYQKVKVPVLNIGGWYDIFEVGTVRNFLGMRSEGGTPEARAGTKLIMRASAHAPAPNTPPTAVGDVDFGPNNTLDVDAVSLRFYDRDLAEGSARIEILRAWTIPAVDLPRRVGPDGVGQRRKVDMRAQRERAARPRRRQPDPQHGDHTAARRDRGPLRPEREGGSEAARIAR
jgi:hypothetical protein